MDWKKEGPKLALALIAAGFAGYLWVQGLSPEYGTMGGSALTTEDELQIAREYAIPPLPQQPMESIRGQLLNTYISTAKANPFDPLIAASLATDGTVAPSDGSQPSGQVGAPIVLEPSPGFTPEMMASTGAQKVGKTSVSKSGSSQVVKSPSTLPQNLEDSISVRAIGEAGGVFSTIIQIGQEADVYMVGSTLAQGKLRIKKITPYSVIFQRGKKEFARPLGEGE